MAGQCLKNWPWSIKNTKDNSLHTYGKGFPGILQLLPVLDFNQSKEKKMMFNSQYGTIFQETQQPLVAS